MIHTVKNYFYDRRKGFAKTAGVIGGFYLVKRYVTDRLEEAKEKVMEEQQARDR